MPSVSAFASWMDNFKSPLREIKAKYTKSEMSLICWDSKLRSYNLSLGMKESKAKIATSESTTDKEPVKTFDDVIVGGVREVNNAYVLPKGVNNGVPIKKKFFDENGDLDLRRGTGEEVARYMRGLGIKLPVIFPKKK